jgi:hypothetical protein
MRELRREIHRLERAVRWEREQLRNHTALSHRSSSGNDPESATERPSYTPEQAARLHRTLDRILSSKPADPPKPPNLNPKPDRPTMAEAVERHFGIRVSPPASNPAPNPTPNPNPAPNPAPAPNADPNPPPPPNRKERRRLRRMARRQAHRKRSRR